MNPMAVLRRERWNRFLRGKWIDLFNHRTKHYYIYIYMGSNVYYLSVGFFWWERNKFESSNRIHLEFIKAKPAHLRATLSKSGLANQFLHDILPQTLDHTWTNPAPNQPIVFIRVRNRPLSLPLPHPLPRGVGVFVRVGRDNLVSRRQIDLMGYRPIVYYYILYVILCYNRRPIVLWPPMVWYCWATTTSYRGTKRASPGNFCIRS